MTSFSHFGQSFIGRRKMNQDSFCIHPLGEETVFMAVADGMGGTQGGEIASRLCIDTAKAFLIDRFAGQVDPSDLSLILRELNTACQQAVHDEIQLHPDHSGMGTTLATVLIHDRHYACSNIGDSRIYILQADTIRQISRDHTYVQDFADQHQGKVPDQVIRQYSHYLTRCLDGSNYLPDIFPGDKAYALDPDSLFMICSDGLILDKVYTNTHLLKNYITGTNDLKRSAENLISYAYYGGSGDNITVVLCETGTLPRRALKLKQLPYPPSEEIDPYAEITTRKKKSRGSRVKVAAGSAGHKIRKLPRIWFILGSLVTLGLLTAAVLAILRHYDVIELDI